MDTSIIISPRERSTSWKLSQTSLTLLPSAYSFEYVVTLRMKTAAALQSSLETPITVLECQKPSPERYEVRGKKSLVTVSECHNVSPTHALLPYRAEERMCTRETSGSD